MGLSDKTNLTCIHGLYRGLCNACLPMFVPDPIPEPVKGRPSVYSEELALSICERISNGESLKQICKDPDMPARSTVHLWLLQEDKKAFSDKYELSVNIRAENMFDELTEIADDGTNDYMTRTNSDGEEYEVVNNEHIQRSRLRTDVRKWYLSKVMPKKYGDKLDMTSDGKAIQGNAIVFANFKKEEEKEDGTSAV